jgi:hypothetical protein
VTQTVVLGDHRYTVTIGPYTPAGPPGSIGAGSISAHAIITVEDIITELPEPGTLALSCLGGALLAVRGGRRLRRQLLIHRS